MNGKNRRKGKKSLSILLYRSGYPVWKTLLVGCIHRSERNSLKQNKENVCKKDSRKTIEKTFGNFSFSLPIVYDYEHIFILAIQRLYCTSHDWLDYHQLSCCVGIK